MWERLTRPHNFHVKVELIPNKGTVNKISVTYTMIWYGLYLSSFTDVIEVGDRIKARGHIYVVKEIGQDMNRGDLLLRDPDERAGIEARWWHASHCCKAGSRADQELENFG